ncbi:YwqJ-related putative deaminase [Streptomyces longispororuber]|uniref:YwqJ-related putative deaminase n=1 Tax=Streptomyces longispororuber TaxID=68230 RepID=UPI00210CA21B|nr:YwqJ-related putative deaminase [Streptomyces longispororuber]MCQ4208440.1 YwqJ-related putative deaminase [Streptomyces longispororuber]
MPEHVPLTAASLLVHGRIYSQTDLDPDAEPDLHPAVTAFFQQLPPARREPFVGYCAESALISDQLWGLDQERTIGGPTTLDEAKGHFAGSALVTRKVRPAGDPEHGRHAEPCWSCAALIERLGIESVDG